MKSSWVILAGIGLLAGRADDSRASNFGYEWGGDGCMPSMTDILNYTFIQDDGEIRHNAAPGVVVTLHCPVTRQFLDYPPNYWTPNYIQLSYADSSHDPNTNVTATLVQMSLADGTVKAIAGTSSDKLSCDVGYPNDCQDGKHHMMYDAIGKHMDMLANIYYVEVKISRASWLDTATFAGVQLMSR
ncbi:MAG: hypothetical protein ABI678_05595 [Kofleriaceae bacterium]